uniref:Ig-like domain-containing protein n=1 Tax=Seriola lalandi dorsalis TaxID=1841481 RepID=A0A3B4WX29_SERLL
MFNVLKATCHSEDQLCLLNISSQSDTSKIKCCALTKVKPGEDVTLQCRGPRDAEIKLIKWIRPDLKSEDYVVFFYRDKRLYEQFQLPSYRGRVELTDPDMKDGDVSVILKNVTINDAARYECQVGKKGSRPQVISTITLKVVDSGEFVQVNLSTPGAGLYLGGVVGLTSLLIYLVCVYFMFVTPVLTELIVSDLLPVSCFSLIHEEEKNQSLKETET